MSSKLGVELNNEFFFIVSFLSLTLRIVLFLPSDTFHDTNSTFTTEHEPKQSNLDEDMYKEGLFYSRVGRLKQPEKFLETG